MRDCMVQPPFCDNNQTSCVLTNPPTCCGSVTEVRDSCCTAVRVARTQLLAARCLLLQAVGFWVSFNTVCVFLLLSLVVAIIIKVRSLHPWYT